MLFDILMSGDEAETNMLKHANATSRIAKETDFRIVKPKDTAVFGVSKPFDGMRDPSIEARQNGKIDFEQFPMV